MGSAAAYDSKTNRVYIHGGTELVGATSVRYVDELWAYDLDTDHWVTISEAPTRPGPRVFHDITIDTERRKLHLFGGKAPGTEFGCSADLWTLSLDTFEWTLTAPENPFVFFGLQDPIVNVHAPTGDVWVHFGGCDGEVVPPYYFRWGSAQGGWTRFIAELDEAPRRQAGLGAYDTLRDRILITGGTVFGFGTEEGTRLWRSVRSFDPSAIAWEPLSDGSQGPQKRGWMVGGFDDLSDLFVTFGGHALWPPRGCSGCIGLSTLSTFDMKNGQWRSVEVDTAYARVYGAGDYCRCTGELMVHAGSQSPSVSLGYRYRFQSQAFFVAIEHQANFRWLTPAHRQGENPRVSGVLDLEDPSTGRLLGHPVLVDCSTRESLQVASDLQPLGGSRYRVTFPSLDERTLDAQSRDRLILVGRIEGDSRAVLARIRPEPLSRERVQETSSGRVGSGRKLGADRVEGGWRIVLTGPGDGHPVRFTVHDVRGRRMFSAHATAGAASEAGVIWDGVDLQGRVVPQGVYFVRAEFPGGSDRTRFILLRPYARTGAAR